MEDSFGYLMFAVVAISAVIALLSLSGDRHEHIGRGGLFEEESRGQVRRPPPSGGPAAAAEHHEEVRQMMEARNVRRRARGQEELDVDAEVARLTRPTPAADPALVAEVRVLVEKRNARRVRKGQEPLDVEAEIERQLRDISG